MRSESERLVVAECISMEWFHELGDKEHLESKSQESRNVRSVCTANLELGQTDRHKSAPTEQDGAKKRVFSAI